MGTRRPLVLVLLLGCGNSSQELEGIERAVARARLVADGSRVAALAGLRDAPCSRASLCDVKGTCLTALEQRAHAIALRREVDSKMETLRHSGGGSPATLEALREDLSRAEKWLDESAKGLGRCDAELVRLRRGL